MTTAHDRITAERLTAEWRQAVDDAEAAGTDHADRAEQDAYDRLIDHIERAGLNSTRWDPRPTPA